MKEFDAMAARVIFAKAKKNPNHPSIYASTHNKDVDLAEDANGINIDTNNDANDHSGLSSNGINLLPNSTTAKFGNKGIDYCY